MSSNTNGQTGTDLALRVANEQGFTETQLELIRTTAAKGCSTDEVAQLLIMARRTGLDPLARQIYMIKRWDGQAKREVATPQTGIDGYRLTADRTERYAPGREPTYAYDEHGNLWSATAYVKKLAGGAWHEVAATAFWAEYVQTKKDGNPTATWAKMPHLMLAKCAEALALRRAFPAELSGLYTKEEMEQADNESEPILEAEYREVSASVSHLPTCERCGESIRDYRTMSAAKIAEGTREKYGATLCWDCAQQAKAQAERESRAGKADDKIIELSPSAETKARGNALVRFNTLRNYAADLGLPSQAIEPSATIGGIESQSRELFDAVTSAISAVALMDSSIPSQAIPHDNATLEEWMEFVAEYDLKDAIREEIADVMEMEGGNLEVVE